MKKFYYKKDVEQEETPILNRIERRKTLLDLAKEINSDQWHEMAVRTLSGTSRCQPEVSKGASSSSATSTFVITDSDLASSWIYTSKRDAANEVFESNRQDQELQEVHSTPTFSISRWKPCCKFCCCFSVAAIITLCVIGIFSTIGGIVYLEVFAPQATSPSFTNDSQTSIKTSGFYLTNGRPAANNSGTSVTSREREPESADVLDFKSSTTVPESLRRGKFLLHDESTTDLSVLHAYVNGTLNAMKNVFQLLSDANDRGSNTRGLQSNNQQRRNNLVRNTDQSLLRKLTSFLFGGARSSVLVGNSDRSTTEESKTHPSFETGKAPEHDAEPYFNSGQPGDLGSGDAVEDDGNLSEWDLSRSATGLVSKIRTFPTESVTTSMEDLANDGDSPSMRDLFLKRISENFPISPPFQESLSSTSSSRTQRKASRSLEVGNAYRRNNVSASLAELFKIFRSIDRMKSAVSVATSTYSQENLIQVGTPKVGTEMEFGRNRTFSLQERNQYLQRLRNLAFSVDEAL